jgi:hypothetical protein
MPILTNPKHEAFAQGLARGLSAAAAYVEAGYKANRHNAAALAREKHIRTRVTELQEEQLAIHQQATAEAAARAKVTIESLIIEAEAARVKAMSEKGGAAAAVSALIAKAKLAGMWRERVDQHNSGSIQYERIERVIVEHDSDDAAQSLSGGGAVRNEAATKAQGEINREGPYVSKATTYPRWSAL